MVPIEPELVKLLYKPSQWAVNRTRRSTTGAAST